MGRHAVVIAIWIGFAGGARAQLDESTFRAGDLIFQVSTSMQSAAIAEVQGSPFTHVGLLFRRAGTWQVLEAVGPVRWTPLATFARRGRAVEVYRLNDSLLVSAAALERAAVRFLGRRYDLMFEWDDRRIYCSELVFKAYRDAGVDLGGLTDWATVPLEGAHTRALLRRRGGRRPSGPLSTPESLRHSSALVRVQ